MTNRNTGLKNGIKSVKEAALRFVYPSFCLHCNAPIALDKRLCADCSRSIEFSEPGSGSALVPFGPIVSWFSGSDRTFPEESVQALAALTASAFPLHSFPPIDFLCPSPKEKNNFLFARYLSEFLSLPVKKALRPEGMLFSGYRTVSRLCYSDKTLLVVGIRYEPPESFFPLRDGAPKEIFRFFAFGRG